MSASERLVLIDGYAHIYRSFYAIRELTNAQGEPTNALFALARFLLRFEQEIPHRYGAVVMDKGPPRERLEILPEYKATRAPMPEALRSQLAPIRDWIHAAGWPIVEEEGREADDLIAALVEARAGCEVMIVSHDKDLSQLVQPGVVLLTPGKRGSFVRFDESAVQEKFGVPPQAIPDYLALTGDAVDNIPGVAGVGPKTAAALLQEHGNAERLFANLDALPQANLRRKLQDAQDLVRRNLKLVRLDSTPPCGWTGLDGIRRREPD